VAPQAWAASAIGVLRNDALIMIFRSDTTWEKRLRLSPISIGVPPRIVTADSVPTAIIQVVFAVHLFVMLRRVYCVSPWVRRIARRLHCMVVLSHSLAVPILVVCRHPEVTLTTVHSTPLRAQRAEKRERRFKQDGIGIRCGKVTQKYMDSP
jgi:hypothetical protein